MHVIYDVMIPFWFFGFESFMYLLSGVIGFGISHYAFKLYRMTSKKSHMLFYLSFTLLGMGLVVLALSNAHTYFFVAQSCMPECTGSVIFDNAFGIDDLGYWIYYATSLVAFLMLAIAYTPSKIKFPVIILPVWYSFSPYFHLVAFFILSYIIYRSASNYFLKKTRSACLVALGFALIGLYQVLQFLTSFNEIVYVAAHLSLVIGFVCLLLMLVGVTRKGKRMVR